MVSIIINCFNGESFLKETLDSVLNQTYKEWRLLLFDNCSIDRTTEIFKQYEDKRFSYFHRDNTVSLGKARNEALSMVEGDYICFLDADDLWEPTHLEELVNIVHLNRNIGLVYSDYLFFSGDKNIRYNKTGPQGIRDINSLLRNYDIGLSAALFRRDVVITNNIRFNDQYNLIEDLDFFISIATCTNVYHIEKILVRYRIHDNNLSNKLNVWSDEYLCFYNKLLVLYEKDLIERSTLQYEYSMYLYLLFQDMLRQKCYLKAFCTCFRMKMIKSVKCLIRLLYTLLKEFL